MLVFLEASPPFAKEFASLRTSRVRGTLPDPSSSTSPRRPNSKDTRENHAKANGPGKAIKMTCLTSVDEKVHQGDGSNLSIITLQSGQRMTRSASFSSPSLHNSSSNIKAMIRSHDRKWAHEGGIVTHEEELKDIIKSLENCRKTLENDGQYLQAAVVTKQLHALKIFVENKKREMMLATHIKEKEEAEASYTAELNEKNNLWNERFKVFQNEVIQHVQFLKQQHAIALQNFKTKMDTKIPTKPHLSRELINERKVQTFLGRQGKYLEAQKVKASADRKEMKQLQSTIASYQAEIVLKEQAVKAKQQTEMTNLLQRAAQTRDELRRNKGRDVACCTQRHKNILRDLEALHKQERLKLDHKLKKIVHEFRAVGGDMRDLSHAMQTIVVPALSGSEDAEKLAASSSSVLEIECFKLMKKSD